MITKRKQFRLVGGWVLIHSQKLVTNIKDVYFVIESELLKFVHS